MNSKSPYTAVPLRSKPHGLEANEPNNRLSPNYPSVYFGMLNIDEVGTKLAEKYGVAALPTTIFLKDGKETKRQVAGASEGQWNEWIQAALQG